MGADILCCFFSDEFLKGLVACNMNYGITEGILFNCERFLIIQIDLKTLLIFTPLEGTHSVP